MKEQVERLNTEMTDMKKNMTLMGNNMNALKNEFNAAIYLIDESSLKNENGLSQAFTEISNIHADTSILSTHIRETSSDISDIQTRLNFSQKDIAILRTSVTDAADAANACKSDIDDLAGHMDNINATQLHFSKDVVDKMKSLSDRIDHLEDNFVELFKHSEDLGTQISQMDGKIDRNFDRSLDTRNYYPM